MAHILKYRASVIGVSVVVVGGGGDGESDAAIRSTLELCAVNRLQRTYHRFRIPKRKTLILVAWKSHYGKFINILL